MTSPHIPGQAQLRLCRSDAQMWRLLFLLRPFAQSQHLPPFENQERRRLWPRPDWNRARTPAEIPQQRVAPPGTPARPVTTWGTRSGR